MLLNPYTDKSQLETYGDSRLLVRTFGLIGQQIEDPRTRGRLWTVHAVYAPSPARKLGGIRVRLVDNKDFITFINQRDLEVLLELAEPGQYCRWTGEAYFGPDDREWCGFFTDHDDLLDDLYDRELLLRSDYPEVLPSGIEITRRVHIEDRVDVEELLALLGDFDAESGYYPDPRFETVGRRWSRVERRKVQWDRVD